MMKTTIESVDRKHRSKVSIESVERKHRAKASSESVERSRDAITVMVSAAEPLLQQLHPTPFKVKTLFHCCSTCHISLDTYTSVISKYLHKSDIELNEIHKFLNTLVYFILTEVNNSFGAEFLYAKRCHSRTKNDSPFHVVE